MPTLCATFRNQAGVVWNNMSAAAKYGLWLSEETLTEWVQYNIAILHQGHDFVVELATKPKESKHGGDWEWWFTKGNIGIGFRVQAKRLFRPGQYSSLFKSSANPYDQLDKLVHRAAVDVPVRVPLYCFYNFGHRPSQFAAMPNTCGHSYRQPSFWGCSIAFPAEIKQAKSDHLTVLKKYMRPWHSLVCHSSKTDLVQAVQTFLRQARGSTDDFRRELPSHIQRLIAFGTERRQIERDREVSEAWSAVGDDADEELSGIAVYRDTRSE